RFEGVGPRIRLWGIDAPEKNEPGGSAASAAMVRLVKGLIVSYIEVDRDRYRRIVARVFLPDGRELNRVMLEHGVAREYCRYSKGFYGMCPSKVRVRHSRLH
nr:thermonuclease family protein [Gammaproteobacteria bacterium]